MKIQIDTSLDTQAIKKRLSGGIRYKLGFFSALILIPVLMFMPAAYQPIHGTLIGMAFDDFLSWVLFCVLFVTAIGFYIGAGRFWLGVLLSISGLILIRNFFKMSDAIKLMDSNITLFFSKAEKPELHSSYDIGFYLVLLLSALLIFAFYKIPRTKALPSDSGD